MLGAKPLASLSSGLLARKGQARPAMRPGGIGGLGSGALATDDLGWNDMGATDGPANGPPPRPPVLIEREALKDEVEQTGQAAEKGQPSDAQASPDPVVEEAAAISPELAARIGRDAVRVGKAAFTLRLPADRHLRLRLASAVGHRSAQAIVTDALDAFLLTLPEVEELACRCSTPNRLGNCS